MNFLLMPNKACFAVSKRIKRLFIKKKDNLDKFVNIN